MASKLLFLISESFRGLYRTKLPALISSITISISLIILSVAIFAYYNFISLTKNIKSEFAIETFFYQDTSYENAVELYNKILLIEGIEQGEFIDKERASKIFKKYFNEDIEKMIGENPLPMGANYIVSDDYRNYNDIRQIVLKIKRFDGVEEVTFQQQTIQRINRIIEIILLVSFFIGLFILFISIILVSNTITLIIYSKKRTIEILQLLGSTNSFIKFPFFLEGIMQGFFGSLLSVIFLFVLNSIQIYFIDSIIDVQLVIPSIIIPFNFILGIILGVIGSYRGLLHQVQ